VVLNSSPVFADLDGDGDLDAFIGERYGNTFFFQNTGCGNGGLDAGEACDDGNLVDADACNNLCQTAGVGDCDGDGRVAVDELVKGVNIALGTASLQTCPAFDSNGDRLVTIDELQQAVNRALGAS